ncbi:MAG: glycosyltransferase [Flavobacteriales bacterium]|nr:glycosyltransferase [Flavobacteriales bacterium]
MIFIDWYLPGFKAGGPIRSCANLVAHLSKYFEFYIITRNIDYCEVKPYQSIISNEWNKQEDGSSVFYMSNDNLSYSSLKKVVKSLEYDIAYVNGIYSRYFSIYPLILLKNEGKLVVVAVRGMLAKSAISVKPFKKRIFLFLASQFSLYRRVVFHATNIKEKSDIIDCIGADVVVRIASNLHKLNSNGKIEQIEKQVSDLKLISIARVSPEKNLIQLLEKLSKHSENICLDIYGTLYDKDYWEACKILIENMPGNVNVKYCGVVHPREIERTIAKYHFLILLSFGENFGHVILESFIAARPVIISDQTPWKDLDKNQLGWDLNLENESEVSTAITTAAQMNQHQFDKYVKSCIQYAGSIIEDETIVKQSVILFNKE